MRTTATGVLVCTQVFNHQLELAVADAGIGVRTHLARNPKYRHVNEVEALDYAAHAWGERDLRAPG